MRKPRHTKPAARAKPAAKPGDQHPGHPHQGHGQPGKNGKPGKNKPPPKSLLLEVHPPHRPRKKPKRAKKPKPSRKPRHAPGLALGGGWVLGGNGELPTCAAAAVANHLLWSAGAVMPAGDVIALWAAAGDVLEDVLAAAGCRACPVDPDSTPGLVLGVGPHAVLSLGGWWVTWGGVARPWAWPDEAWKVTWAH